MSACEFPVEKLGDEGVAVVADVAVVVDALLRALE
jgi:hypothetical protein